MDFNKKLKKHIKECNPKGTNHYFFENGFNEFNPHINEVCFAECTSISIKKLTLYINQHTLSNNPKEMIEYFKWVMEESPWKKAFLHYKKHWLRDGIQMNVSHPSYYVVGAMCAMRHAWEFCEFLPSFKMFQEMGLSKNLSFILAQHLKEDGRYFYENTNHSTFEIHNTTKNMIRNFKKGRYIKVQKPMKEDARDYRKIWQMFQHNKKDEPSIDTLLQPFRKKKGIGWDIVTYFDFKDEATIQFLRSLDV